MNIIVNMKYFIKVLSSFGKGLLAIPAAIIFLLTVILIGLSNLVKMAYSDSDVPVKFIIERLEEEPEVKLKEVAIVEESVEEVIKPKQVRKPRVKKVVEEVVVNQINN